MRLRTTRRRPGIGHAQQPLNNVARVAIQALAAALGGAVAAHQLLRRVLACHGGGGDVALRTQQIVARRRACRSPSTVGAATSSST